VTSDYHFEDERLEAVAIAKILPKLSQQELFSYKRCYLGISLENPVFDSRSLRAILCWASERFESCLVIVGDHLRRFNERILNGLDDAEAAKAAEKIGDVFVLKTKGLFEQFDGEQVRLTRWKEHLHGGEFKESKEVIEQLFVSDEQFRASVEKDAVSFVNRQHRRGQRLAVEQAEAIGLCCEYLLEEIAVFSALSERGWRVELYPGPELRVLTEVARGKYPFVPRGLKERISVELKVGAGARHKL